MMSPPPQTIGIILFGGLLVVFLGSPIVSRIVRPYSTQLDDEPGLANGGRVIGFSERLLIYVFVLAGAPSAIGFLVTAKSLFRFGELTGNAKHQHAEYVIIGTLVSFAYAVTLSYLVRWALSLLR